MGGAWILGLKATWRLAALVLGLLWLGPALAFGPLLTPEALQVQLQQAGGGTSDALRVVDVRESDAYALQHVPGAVSAPFGRWRSTGENFGKLPDAVDLTALVQELGLRPEVPTVIVFTGIDANDFGGAARAYWVLKSLGVQQLAILDGGLSAWTAASLPPSDTPVQVAASDWQPDFNPQWMATREQVLASLQQPQVLRVDARPAPFFEGRLMHEAARARGTLPGAVNLDSELLFELGSAELLPPNELTEAFDDIGVQPTQPVILFCNAGHWSATDWFVLSEVLGHADARMYPGSMLDWTQAAQALPMEREPGRLEQLRYALLGWAHRNLGTAAP